MTLADRIASGISLMSVRMLVVQASQVGVAVILLRSLGPDQFGLYALATAVSWLAYLATANPEDGLRRFLPEFLAAEDWDSARVLVQSGLAIKALLTLAVGGALVAAAPTIAIRFDQQDANELIFAMSALHLCGTSLENIGQNLFLGIQRHKALAGVSIAGALAALAGAGYVAATGVDVLAAFTLLVTIRLAFSALLLALAIFGVKAAVPTTWLWRPGRDLLVSVVGRQVRYIVPLLGVLVGTTIHQHAAKIALGAWATPAVVGYFSVAKALVEYTRNLFGQVSAVLLPVLAERLGKEDGEPPSVFIVRLSPWLHFAAVWTTSALLLFAPEVVLLLAGRGYDDVLPVIRLMSWQLLLVLPMAVWGILYQVHERVLRAMWQHVGRTAVLTLGLLVLAERTDAITVTVAEIAALALGLVWMTLDLPHVFEVPRSVLVKRFASTLAAAGIVVALSSLIDLSPSPAFHLAARAGLLAGVPGIAMLVRVATRRDVDDIRAMSFASPAWQLAQRATLAYLGLFALGRRQSPPQGP